MCEVGRCWCRKCVIYFKYNLYVKDFQRITLFVNNTLKRRLVAFQNCVIYYIQANKIVIIIVCETIKLDLGLEVC